MCNPVLIYLTNGYPYSADEVFPEDEFPYLCHDGRDIFILPRLGRPHEGVEPPGGARVLPWLLPDKRGRMPFMFYPAMLPLLHAEYADCRRAGIRPGLVSMVKALATALHARSVLRRLIRGYGLERRPILIYSFWFTETVTGAGMLRREFPQLRVITRAHGGDIYADQSSGGYLPLRFQRLAVVDMVCPCSRNGAEVLLRDGLEAEKCVVARLGVPSGKALAPASPEGQLALVSCGFTVPVKRLPLLADSLAAFAARRGDMRVAWHHLGGGDGFEAFCRYAGEKLSALPNIRFIPHGHMPVAEVRSFLAGQAGHPIDALVNVSHSEGLPVSMMEALAAGLPLVGTDVGGVREIVTPETGVLLNRDFTAEEFANALERLSLWKDARKRAANAEFFRKNFSAANYRDFADRIIAPQLEISEQILNVGMK